MKKRRLWGASLICGLFLGLAEGFGLNLLIWTKNEENNTNIVTHENFDKMLAFLRRDIKETDPFSEKAAATRLPGYAASQFNRCPSPHDNRLFMLVSDAVPTEIRIVSGLAAERQFSVPNILDNQNLSIPHCRVGILRKARRINTMRDMTEEMANISNICVNSTLKWDCHYFNTARSLAFSFERLQEMTPIPGDFLLLDSPQNPPPLALFSYVFNLAEILREEAVAPVISPCGKIVQWSQEFGNNCLHGDLTSRPNSYEKPNSNDPSSNHSFADQPSGETPSQTMFVYLLVSVSVAGFVGVLLASLASWMLCVLGMPDKTLLLSEDF